MLGKLEDNMVEADQHVEKGVENLKSAKKKQGKASCCMKALVCIIFLALIIVGIILYFSLRPDPNNNPK